jgi:hypothetical protein
VLENTGLPLNQLLGALTVGSGTPRIVGNAIDVTG